MRMFRSGTAESIAHGVSLLAVALAAKMWLADLQVLGTVRIDAVIIGLSLLSIVRGTTFGIVAGFLIGIVLDALNPAWMGGSAVAYAIVGFFSGSFGQTLYMEKSMARGLLVMGAVVIFDIVSGLLTVGLAASFWPALAGTLGSALLSGSLTILITRVMKQWQDTAATDAAPVDG